MEWVSVLRSYIRLCMSATEINALIFLTPLNCHPRINCSRSSWYRHTNLHTHSHRKWRLAFVLFCCEFFFVFVFLFWFCYNFVLGGWLQCSWFSRKICGEEAKVLSKFWRCGSHNNWCGLLVLLLLPTHSIYCCKTQLCRLFISYYARLDYFFVIASWNIMIMQGNIDVR